MFEVWLARKMREQVPVLDNKKVAEAVGVDPSTVGRWLEGKMKPNRVQVMRLARLFHVSIGTVVQNTDPDEFDALMKDGERQGEYLDSLAQSDESDVTEMVRRLRRASPKRRAAWLTLLMDEDEGTDQ